MYIPTFSKGAIRISTGSTKEDPTNMTEKLLIWMLVYLFDLILYIPSTIFQLNKEGSSWVEPVLS